MGKKFLITSILVFICLTSLQLISAQSISEERFKGCWGAILCGEEFTCGYYDGVCVDNFFAKNSNPLAEGGCLKYFDDEGYRKCIDPDCHGCIFGRVIDRNALNEPKGISNANVTFEIKVWDGEEEITIKKETKTDIDGNYEFDINAGNNGYITVKSPGYEIEQKHLLEVLPGSECVEHNFSLKNGTCTGDCTVIGSNFCAARCDGEVKGEDMCLFNKETTFQLSNNKVVNIRSPIIACTQTWGAQKNSVVKLGEDPESDLCVYAKCCEGEPYERPCPSFKTDDLSEGIFSSKLKDAVKTTKILSYKGTPIKLHVYYWE